LQRKRVFAVPNRTLDDQEMIDILEEIARSGSNQAARIAAIKTLREIDSGSVSVDKGFEGLYEVANPGRIRAKAS
jgi:ABC-type polar amino acid transport system ATPase subunit